MDGKFVGNETSLLSLPELKTKKEVHLMVEDVKKYVNLYQKYHPQFITFHIEIEDDIKKTIDYIKSLGIKVGIAINPGTPIQTLLPYIEDIDLVLVMCVNPGAGGQKFIDSCSSKIETLARIRKEKKYSYLIEVDGGINNVTKDKCHDADILVIGSYITTSDNYQEKLATISK